MAYSLVTATDFADLLNELEIFLETQGWVVDWNTGTQFGCHSGNCYAAFGVNGQTNPANETDTYPDPDVGVQDFRVYGSLAKSFSATNQYWNQPGSPVSTQINAFSIHMNDLLGPFSEVHFFGDDTYVWVVVRSDVDRWTHFGFGNIDKKGMTHPDCAFFVGIFWRWWDNGNFTGNVPIKANFSYNNGDLGNKVWMRSVYNNQHLYIPDGVLDPAYLADDVIQFGGITNMASIAYNGYLDYGSYGNARPMDHYTFLKQKPVTGGLPLISVPVLASDGFNYGISSTLLTFLGDLPGVRLCDVSNTPIGEELIYGAEKYLAFPLKRRTGDSYDGKASTYGLGVAFKKE